jgi:hypothetical protein
MATKVAKRIKDNVPQGGLTPEQCALDIYPWKLRAKRWWGRWDGVDEAYQGDWVAFYNTLAATSRVTDFYRAFTANAYVVSANGTHGHPETAAILGIAFVTMEDELRRRSEAVDGPKIRRTLYLMTGHILRSRATSSLISGRYSEDGCLHVRYMTKVPFMSISE